MDSKDHGLKKELKLRDLVLMQVLLIVALNSVGYAARQGPSQVVLWLLAGLLFYVPLAVVVIRLSRAIPVEGGVYQWVKEGISPFAGYMAAWSFTIYTVGYYSSISLQVTNGIAYTGGPDAAWLATSKPFALGVTVAISLLACAVNVLGLHCAKWFSGAAGVWTIATVAILLYLLLRVGAVPHAHAHGSYSLSLAWPAFSLVTLNVFTKMAMFSLSGFDQCSIFAEECRKPKNDVARSVLVAAPMIAAMYIICTCAVQAYVADVDVAAPISQTLQAGFGTAWLGRILTLLAGAGYNLVLIAGVVVAVGMVARLPMAAGWDGLLPAWWSELHPRFRTPAKAIVAVSMCVLAMGILSIATSSNQEAVQALGAVGVGSYCITYLFLFSRVAFGMRSQAWRPGIWIRMGALAALLVALVSFVFQVVPVGDVSNPGVFAIKVTVAILATNGLGAFLYWRGKQWAARMIVASAG